MAWFSEMPPPASMMYPPCSPLSEERPVPETLADSALPAITASRATSRTVIRNLCIVSGSLSQSRGPSHFRAHIDAHADAVTRVIRQFGHLPAAGVFIRHTIAFDTIFEALFVTHFTTLGFI